MDKDIFAGVDLDRLLSELTCNDDLAINGSLALLRLVPVARQMAEMLGGASSGYISGSSSDERWGIKRADILAAFDQLEKGELK